MALFEYFLVSLIVVILVLVLLYRSSLRKNSELELRLNEVISRKRSLSTKYGRMTEQFMPFLDSYPYDNQNFRFIGTPIDGIQFENDKIVFVEFKSSDSKLTMKQKEIRDLVNQKKVEFREFRIS